MSVLTITADNFEEKVQNSELPVLLDFWAPWCGPCKMISPHVDKLAEKYAGKIVVGKVNVDEEGELASSFGVSSIPALLVFENGDVAAQRAGGAPPAVLEAFIAPFVG